MRVALLTREFPPEVYGGAGVHVEYLARALGRLAEVEVHCFGSGPGAPPGAADSWSLAAGVTAHRPPAELDGANPALLAYAVDLGMVARLGPVEVVHSHTWYANLAGHWAKLLRGLPHVVTAHSLEPRRPWKAEQLGGGYELSCFAERVAIEGADAIVAVSAAMGADIITTYPEVAPERVQVIHNGIDTEEHQPRHDPGLVRSSGVDPDRPFVLFVGRITRQKGLHHLLRAARHLDRGAQLVLCAGAADTTALRDEVVAGVEDLSRLHRVVWIEEMLPKAPLLALLTAATVFVCPSVYEPMGIVNLEAMACQTAVVASAVGGIPEVVVDGETGLLVPYREPEPEAFEADLARALDQLLADPARAATMGEAGRARAVARFGWPSVARRTLALYRSLV